MLSTKGKRAFTAGVLTLLAFVTVLVVDDDLNALKNAVQLRGRGHRRTSINLGGGKCEWTAPLRTPPADVAFKKILLAGFPSGDKRMAWIQMEALSGLPTQNDWDRYHNGITNSPFIKTNYPHPAGKWSWSSEVDQVSLTVQYIRRSMVEYGDIMSYIDSLPAYNDKKNNLESIYGSRSNADAFYAWRDEHVLSEIYFYGWVIDFWMEKGLYRDPYTHAIIDQDNWVLWNKPEPITSLSDKAKICHRTHSKKNPWIQLEVSWKAVPAHVAHGDFNGTCAQAGVDADFTSQEITDSHLVHDDHQTTDPHCGQIRGGCNPVMLIFADKLRDYSEGPSETARIGTFLSSNPTLSKYVIAQEAWPCIWDQLIDKGVGPASFKDRNIDDDPNFSPFMLEEMINELERMVTKYSGTEWSGNSNAARLVSLFSEHLVLLHTEYDDVISGRRTLDTRDIFGPNESRTGVTGTPQRLELMKKLRSRIAGLGERF